MAGTGARSMYALMYRLRATPWERYGELAGAELTVRLDEEEARRPRRPGRALDLGCGRGQKTRELVRRGWEAVGVDVVPQAVEAARAAGGGATFLVGDLVDLGSLGQGTFDLFLDLGCFEHLVGEERTAAGRGITLLANPGASLLMLEFEPRRWLGPLGGVTLADVRAALPAWDVRDVTPATTEGLGWPMSRMAPTWYSLVLR